MPIQPDWRIGFACHWMEAGKKGPVQSDLTRLRATTSAAIMRLWLEAPSKAHARLEELCVLNLLALEAYIRTIGESPTLERMARIGQDLFPLLTLPHPCASGYYRSKAFSELARVELPRIGRIAIQLGVRLSFHPGQYTVLSSNSPLVRMAGAAEVEAFCRIARMMSPGGRMWHPYGWSVNIHVGSSGMDAIQRFASTWKGLSANAKGILTVENDEFSQSLTALLFLNRLCKSVAGGVGPAIVPDLHHHWIKSAGGYLNPDNPRIQMLVDTWAPPRGGATSRPKLHLSMSRQGLVNGGPGFADDVPHSVPRPNYAELIEAGLTASDLRAHSEGIWSLDVIDWSLGFLDRFDILVESKLKNLASRHVAARAEEFWA